ncbi:succinate dehydrogenase, hydrophobic membrane anchor protein [Vibrio viridaestus]|uniref:Succinate dehydrogenase hydrophobic membrane anchor subunit n=1 Tax=Vibrio viridaestus TaxID=2487322 RepID=A0A3N9TJK9_9VIBR|nr:succinate dehydrogenase, hydrophobic membrane anchor protein [Vibrio viridaestus]RQW64134.1 succinate dehydrogenase, hydrophobic membrane anchor protein [Vibrio viridaestus]
MVKSISSVGRNGVHDFILIRATAIIMTLFTLYMVSFVAFTDNIDYQIWSSFFGSTFTKVFTMITLVCILIHGWIGLWQVLTDYVKCAKLRAGLQLVVIAALLAYFFTGLFVLWGA